MSAQTQSPINALVSNLCQVLQPAVKSTHPRAEVFQFLYRERRLPKIGDERAPWTYCGWMLPYVISLHAHPLFGKSLDNKPIRLRATARSSIGHCPDRWGYHLRTLAAGELLDEPIPRIEFCGEFESSVRRIWEGEREGIAGWCHLIDHNEFPYAPYAVGIISDSIPIDDSELKSVQRMGLAVVYSSDAIIETLAQFK